MAAFAIYPGSSRYPLLELAVAFGANWSATAPTWTPLTDKIRVAEGIKIKRGSHTGRPRGCGGNSDTMLSFICIAYPVPTLSYVNDFVDFATRPIDTLPAFVASLFYLCRVESISRSVSGKSFVHTCRTSNDAIALPFRCGIASKIDRS